MWVRQWRCGLQNVVEGSFAVFEQRLKASLILKLASFQISYFLFLELQGIDSK